MRPRTSRIWDLSSEEFEKLVRNASTYKEIFDFFDYPNRGNNHKTLKMRMKEEGISGEHLGKNYDRIASMSSAKKIPIEKMLIEHSTHNRNNLKNRLIRECLLKNECSICKCSPVWRGKSMTMILDHANGVSDDDRLTNLRLVCPNCNSQLPTHAGRKNKKPSRLCDKCDNKIWRYSKSGLCRPCLGERRRVVDRPSKDVLMREVEDNGYEGTGRKYKVTGNAIKKWIKND